jgi:hypothetical protein
MVNPVYSNTLNQQICEGDSLLWEGRYYSETGVYIETYQSISGCDSIEILELEVLDNFMFNDLLELCEGEVVEWNGQIIEQAGIYFTTLQSSIGCDSIVELQVIYHPILTEELVFTICEGDSMVINGTSYYTAGMFSDTLSTEYGCDSILYISIDVQKVYGFELDIEICEGEVFEFNNNTYSQTGQYTDSLETVFGCDSIYVINLTVNPVYSDTFEIEICEGEVYEFGGVIYSESGEYTNTMQTGEGCDSIEVLILHVLPAISPDIPDYEVGCEGDTIFINIGNYSGTITWSDGQSGTSVFFYTARSLFISIYRFTGLFRIRIDFY